MGLLRLLSILVTALLFGGSVALPAVAQAGPVHLAQDEGIENENAESEDSEGEGQKGAEAESGAGKGAQEEAAEEEGPPWTFQMARISLALILLFLAGMGLLYYRMIATRQRGPA